MNPGQFLLDPTGMGPAYNFQELTEPALESLRELLMSGILHIDKILEGNDKEIVEFREVLKNHERLGLVGRDK